MAMAPILRPPRNPVPCAAKTTPPQINPTPTTASKARAASGSGLVRLLAVPLPPVRRGRLRAARRRARLFIQLAHHQSALFGPN